MGVLADTRMTVLEIINEVKQKLGVPIGGSLTENAQTQALLAYLNDVIDITSDYSDWQEQRASVTVTASSSVFSYLINPTSAAVKNIHEIAFYNSPSPLRLSTIDDMRRWRRSAGGGTGEPRFWVLNGTDNVTTGNPYIEVYPQPGTTENNRTFDILYYKKPIKLTTSDASVVISFPGRLMASGLLAYALLDESRGTNNIDFITQFKAIYNPMLEEAYNRLNGDSGNSTQFVPMQRGFRRM